RAQGRGGHRAGGRGHARRGAGAAAGRLTPGPRDRTRESRLSGWPCGPGIGILAPTNADHSSRRRFIRDPRGGIPSSGRRPRSPRGPPMWLVLVRILVLVLLAHSGWVYAPTPERWIGLTLGILAAVGLITLERKLRAVPGHHLVGSLIGGVIGLFGARL